MRKSIKDYSITELSDLQYAIENLPLEMKGTLNIDGKEVDIEEYIENYTEEFFDVPAEEPVADNVNHPSHYTSHPSGIECIEVTRHYCFSIGNAIKYLWRAGLKKEMGLDDKQKEIEDLEKAIWYIKDRIAQLKKP